MTAVRVHESPARVAVRDLYAAGRQDADGNVTVPWGALLGWSQQGDTMSDTTTANPPCPRIETPCAGRLEYRADPDRLVCDVCCRIWNLDEIAMLTRGRR